MEIYNLLYNAKAPNGIENRKAYIIGGGIAGLATAMFLTHDAHMPGKNIIIYEATGYIGGSMDGKGDAINGYLCRGERELEPFMECLWYICSKTPSLRNSNRSVLDEIWDFNYVEPIHSKYRLIEKQGNPVVDYHNFNIDDELSGLLLKLIYMPENELEGKTIEEFFPKRFFDTNLWCMFHSMLAFKRYHSAIECKRYFRRFLHMTLETDYLHGIIHTDLNEYDAIINPIRTRLDNLGVIFKTGTSITEIKMSNDNNTVIGIELTTKDTVINMPVTSTDMVFFTNGSITQNSCFGDNTTIAKTNRDTQNRGVFTVWEKLAAKDKKFGNPANFISNIDKTKWISFFSTITDYPQFVEKIEKVSGSKAGCGGAITIKNSSWDMSFVLHHKPFFPNQPNNVDVFWAYGLYGENIGDYIKKPMSDCTGNECMTELLYHLGMLDMKDDLIAHTYISTCMMPYITSQFMPRKISDRPKVLPAGCKNLAFIGQFVETTDDAVFTVETSCRTAMQAVYQLTGIEKKQLEVVPTFYDIRYILANIKKQKNINTFTEKDLPEINPLKIKEFENKLLQLLNQVEHTPSVYPGKDHPKNNS